MNGCTRFDGVDDSSLSGMMLIYVETGPDRS